jgi:hypothetical protein
VDASITSATQLTVGCTKTIDQVGPEAGTGQLIAPSGLTTLLPAWRRGHSEDVARKKWQDLSPPTRRLIIAGGAVDGALKIAALTDLARRPKAEVRGSRLLWALAITVVNSVGAVPILYFVRGRRR